MHKIFSPLIVVIFSALLRHLERVRLRVRVCVWVRVEKIRVEFRVSTCKNTTTVVSNDFPIKAGVTSYFWKTWKPAKVGEF